MHPPAARIGLLNTTVYMHAPSSVLLVLVPLMPTPWLAVLCLFLRATMSQMDVPSRKSYSMAVVDPDEQTVTAGITNTARTIASAFSPVLSGLRSARPRLEYRSVSLAKSSWCTTDRSTPSLLGAVLRGATLGAGEDTCTCCDALLDALGCKRRRSDLAVGRPPA
jgi:hypothetical protein